MAELPKKNAPPPTLLPAPKKGEIAISARGDDKNF
jgi:hypothetical protein